MSALRCFLSWEFWLLCTFVPPTTRARRELRATKFMLTVGVVAAADSSTSALTCDASTPGVQNFYSTAMSLTPHTDKVPLYNTMYGIFVMPLLAATNGGVGLKILEIGLGCDYARGNAGKGRTFANSARLWRKHRQRHRTCCAGYNGGGRKPPLGDATPTSRAE